MGICLLIASTSQRNYRGDVYPCNIFYFSIKKNDMREYCRSENLDSMQLLKKYETIIRREIAGRSDITLKSMLYENRRRTILTYCIY